MSQAIPFDTKPLGRGPFYAVLLIFIVLPCLHHNKMVIPKSVINTLFIWGSIYLVWRLLKFRRWRHEHKHVPKFLVCFLLFVAELSWENGMVWLVSALDRRKYDDVPPLQDNLLLLMQAAARQHAAAGRLFTFRWTDITHFLGAQLVLAFCVAWDQMPYSGFGTMSRVLLTVAASRVLRVACFMGTVLPSTWPGCYARRFPSPVPQGFWPLIRAGYTEIRGFGGCNDLIFSGHGAFWVLTPLMFSTFYTSEDTERKGAGTRAHVSSRSSLPTRTVGSERTRKGDGEFEGVEEVGGTRRGGIPIVEGDFKGRGKRGSRRAQHASSSVDGAGTIASEGGDEVVLCASMDAVLREGVGVAEAAMEMTDATEVKPFVFFPSMAASLRRLLLFFPGLWRLLDSRGCLPVLPPPGKRSRGGSGSGIVGRATGDVTSSLDSKTNSMGQPPGAAVGGWGGGRFRLASRWISRRILKLLIPPTIRNRLLRRIASLQRRFSFLASSHSLQGTSRRFTWLGIPSLRLFRRSSLSPSHGEDDARDEVESRTVVRRFEFPYARATRGLLWVAYVHASLHDVYMRQHYTVDMFLAGIVTAATWGWLRWVYDERDERLRLRPDHLVHAFRPASDGSREQRRMYGSTAGAAAESEGRSLHSTPSSTPRSVRGSADFNASVALRRDDGLGSGSRDSEEGGQADIREDGYRHKSALSGVGSMSDDSVGVGKTNEEDENGRYDSHYDDDDALEPPSYLVLGLILIALTVAAVIVIGGKA